MTSFYIVDRQHSLREGLTIELTRYSDISPRELQLHVDDMFPDGLSSHGERYFLRSDALALVASPNIEILFEYVRRAAYPSRPSRFQSVFAFRTLADARIFRASYSTKTEPIWELHAQSYFIADMRLLTAGNSILWYSYLAHKYWKGEPSEDPLWEVLLVPPVTVLRSVE